MRRIRRIVAGGLGVVGIALAASTPPSTRAAPSAEAPGVERATRGGAGATAPLRRRIPEDSLLFSWGLAHSNLDTVQVVLRRDIAEARRTGDREALARLVRFQGIALVMGGDPARAAVPLDEGVRLARAQRDTAILLACIRWRAYVAGVQGRFEDQERMANHLVRVAEARHDTRYEAIGHNFLGWIEHRRGEHRRALAHLTRAVQQERANHDLPDEAVALTALGSTQMALGQYDAARATYVREIAIARQMNQLWSEAEATNDLGVLELEVGDPARAGVDFRRAYEVHRRLGETVNAVDALSNLAGCENLLGRPTEAVRLIREGIAICERRNFALPLGALINSLAEAEDARGRPEAADSARGRVLDAPGEVDGSAFVPAAIGRCDALERAGRTAEALRFLRSARARLRGRTTRMHAVALDDVEARLLLANGQAAEARALARHTTAAAESLRFLQYAMSAWSITSQSEARLGHGVEARAAFERALVDWETLRRRPTDPEWRERSGSQGAGLCVDYVHLLLAEPQAQPRAERIALAFERVQRVKTRTLIERMSGPSAFVQSDSVARVRPIGLRAVQDSVLRDGELLIEWLVAEDRSYRFAVSRESVQVDSGPGLRVLQSEVQDVRGRLAARPAQAGLDGSVETRALSRTMWAGLEGPIARAKRVIIAPDGPVHLVPFAALDLPSPGSPPHALASIARVPSATVLADIRRRVPPRSEAHGLFACAPTGGSLEGARNEVLWLSRHYRDVVTGASDTLELADLEGYRALHLAGHSLVDDRFPWRSAIGARLREAPGTSSDSTALPTLSDRAGGTGGALRAETIASGHLDARLVVLSSCATAGGRVITGEGVAGLSTAFLAAGAPTVLATLWPVDDRASDRFMREFYQGLSQGRTAGEALTRAQERFRRDPRERHPFYWAGFVILGESETRLPLRRRPAVPTGVWAGLAGGLLLGATLLAGRTRRRPAA